MHNRYNLPDVAETEYKKALEIYQKLSKDDPQFLSGVAMTLHNIAAFYDTQKAYQEAEKRYTESD